MIDLQLFGRDFPPFYKKEDILETIDRISKIDEAINDLAIQRETYVKDLKEKIEKAKNNKN